MLPVTCVLTRERATLEHEVQIWNTVALNCVTFPYDSIKYGQPCFKAMSSVSFASVDFFGISLRPPTVTSAAMWLKGGPREGWGGGGLYPFSHPAVAHHDGGVLTQSCGDLMEKRKWLTRLDSPFGDAGLPSSKRMVVLSPLGNLPRFLYHMCSPDPLPPRSLLLFQWCLLKRTPQAVCNTSSFYS